MEFDPTLAQSPPLENWRQRMKDILKKKPDKLTDEEIHILIGRIGYLDNDERTKFASVLTRDKLTEAERFRYTQLKLLNEYFPERSDV